MTDVSWKIEILSLNGHGREGESLPLLLVRGELLPRGPEANAAGSGGGQGWRPGTGVVRSPDGPPHT